MADRQRESVQAERHRRWTTYQDSVRKTAEADPSFKDSLSPRVLQLMPIDALPPGAAPTAQNVIAQEIVTSPSAPALLRHLSAHPEDLDRLERLPHAAAIAREIGRLEAKLETPAVPVLKTTSSAPPPPSTLGTKPSVPADDAEAAIASGDVARYIAIMNRRELAAR